MNTEKFIRNWEKTKHKGKERYVWTNGIINGIAMFVIPTIVTLAKGNEYYIDTHLALLFGGFIGGVIGALISWPRNEEKYNRLVNSNLDK